jgi:AcrR family transcriptional regulator
LDTAADLFDEMGYDATTTKHVADRAGIAVGSLYHWFPDKNAMASALAERYMAELLEAYITALADDPTESTVELIPRVARVLACYVSDNPAFSTLLVSAFARGGENAPGERLRLGLYAQVRALVEARAPGTPADEAASVTDTIVAVTHALLAFAGRFQGEERAKRIDEMVYVLTAYVLAKFPGADSPVWAETDPILKPLVAGRPTKRLDEA